LNVIVPKDQNKGAIGLVFALLGEMVHSGSVVTVPLGANPTAEKSFGNADDHGGRRRNHLKGISISWKTDLSFTAHAKKGHRTKRD